jgi:GTPase SAR1 family protein
MNFRFPLNDVKIKSSKTKLFVDSPTFSYDCMQINQHEFSLTVDDIAHFYAANGNFVQISPADKANRESIELYLNGSVYGAILHQRKIMPIHGSCFIYNNKGIMICGESGAGKSSITASFCHNGSNFLTDDVTPLVFTENLPFILPLSDRIKLWDDSLNQLKLSKNNLTQIWSDYKKYYLPIDIEIAKPFPLHQIFIIEIDNKSEVEFQKLTGVKRFTALRNEIYRWEYLQGMPESEAGYLNQLISISINVSVVKVLRPGNIKIDSLRTILSNYISNQKG